MTSQKLPNNEGKMSSGLDSALTTSWHDSAWIHINQSNIMDYFSQPSNPFYDKTCNNEMVKMQRVSPEQLQQMTGLEYVLLHAQEPILYVIRKQHRHSPTQLTPVTDYYIIAGVVYQAPDLGSVLSSRLMNSIYEVEGAFSEAQSFSKYHPSRGYWWEFKGQDNTDKTSTKEQKKKKEEPSSLFQRQRVDVLLAELARKFPPRFGGSHAQDKSEEAKVEVKEEIKTEKVDERSQAKPPPEKKPKLMR